LPLVHSSPMDKARLLSLIDTTNKWGISFCVVAAIGAAGLAVVAYLNWRLNGQLGALDEIDRKAHEMAIAAATSAAADANARSAEANARAAEADLARVRLENRLAPRNLTAEQIQAIADKMRPFTSGDIRQNVAVFPYPPSAEANNFAEQLFEAFARAGCTMNRNAVTYGLRIGSFVGVGVLSSPDPRGMTVADAAAAAVRSAGVIAYVLPERRVVSQAGDRTFDAAISVFVGEHP
jgi:hypothetical protein